MKKTLNITIEIILYFIAAIAFFGFIYVGLDMFSGVFATGYRTAPAFISYFMPVYFLILYHRLSHAKSLEWLKKHARINGAVILSLSFFVIVLDICYFSLGEFNGLIENTVTPLFPLDTICISLLSAGIGAYLFFKKEFRLPSDILYLTNESKLRRYLSFFMKGMGTGFSLFMVGGLIWGLDFAYYEHPYFPNMTPLFLLMAGIGMLLGYDIFIESYPIHPMSKRYKIISLSILTLYILAAMISVTIIFVKIPNIIIIVGQPYFRIDAIGNLNIAPFVLLIPPAIYCAYLWAIQFVKKKD